MLQLVGEHHLQYPPAAAAAAGLLGNPPCVFSPGNQLFDQSEQAVVWAISLGGEGNYYGDVLCFADALIQGD